MNDYERLNEQRLLESSGKRVAAYCRVSTDKEDQANSFESQQRFFKEYIERRPNWELIEIYADEGLSGTTTKKRIAFNRMIASAREGEFDLILTKEISRFARNTLDSIFYTRELKRIGVGVYFMNDNINTLDADAELRLAIMSSIAQEESRKTSDRVKWGQQRRMEQGVVFGRSMLGYDVKEGKMTINDDGAKIVQLIFDKFVKEGKGTHVIARELQEAGVSTMHGKKWSNTVILRVLRNEKYCGDLVQKKTYTPDYLSHEKKYNRGQEQFVILKDHHDPIISRELFEAANKMIEGRASSQAGKAKYSNRYCFSGKIKCGYCGASCVARTKKRKDQSRSKLWRCLEAAHNGAPHIDQTGNTAGCCGASIRDEDALYIMSLVCASIHIDRQQLVANLLRTIQYILSSEHAGSGTGIPCDRAAAIKEKKTRLLELYMSKNITKEEFIKARDKCDQELEQCDSAFNSLEKQKAVVSQQETSLLDITNTVHEIVKGLSHDEEFYRSLLDKMVINQNDRIDVHLKLLPHKWQYAPAEAAKQEKSK